MKSRVNFFVNDVLDRGATFQNVFYFKFLIVHYF